MFHESQQLGVVHLSGIKRKKQVASDLQKATRLHFDLGMFGGAPRPGSKTDDGLAASNAVSCTKRSMLPLAEGERAWRREIFDGASQLYSNKRIISV